MTTRILLILLSLALFINNSYAAASSDTESQQQIQHIRDLLQHIVDANLQYKDKFHTIISESALSRQTPKITVLLCSDSRVDTRIISDAPIGEVFVIRNIGNQLETSYGSVEYGVLELATELLLIIGHSQCGAVKAAMHDYSQEPYYVRKELDTLEVNNKAALNANIVKNVSNQVKDAVANFSDRIKDNKLVVIGMVYDLHNDFKYGDGQLILVNINNNTDPHVLAEHKYISGLNNLVIMSQEN